VERVGILLAGGTGSRLAPITSGVSKQLLPVYDKPQFYYALTTLMLADVREICIVTNPQNTSLYKSYFGDGSPLGIVLHYIPQREPKGIADAFNVCSTIIKYRKTALILGDNVFIGNELTRDLSSQSIPHDGATVFLQEVSNPCEYGAVKYNKEKKIVKIIEKPKTAPSNDVVTGLYFYDESVIERVNILKPSARGELEISDLNSMYLADDKINFHKFGRGHIWFDTGNPRDLLDAGNLIEILQRRTSLMFGCPEEVALSKGWISKQHLLQLSRRYSKTNYGSYLERIAR
jgi:glucose-1-phosphate thymidylyltransferase